jgi:hypothetical protein
MKAVGEALSSPDPITATAALLKHPLYKSAHPTDEHFLGLPVAVAATDKGEKLETIYLGSDKTRGLDLGWGFWRWTSQ